MSQIIVLALNGEPIMLKQMQITPSMQFKEKDQSGQSSSTNKAEQGISPKELQVSGLVPYDEPEILTKIWAMAEAVGESGELKTYRVACPVAQAINFREATFSSSITAAPQGNKLAWLVSFTLKEKQSIPEKKQARAGKVGTAKTQSPDGAKVEDLSEPEEELSWFEEKVLGPINGLGDDKE